MAIYDVTPDALKKLAETSFSKEHLLERKDLQRLLRQDISVLDEELLVISEEFGDWEDSQRRIDLLCLDTDASLVVVELKRTEDGGHMELQAIRYAAMVSTMTFDQAVHAYAMLTGTEQPDEAGAQTKLLAYLGWDAPREGEFAQTIRLILVAADFSKELTTSVIWLNKQGLDVRCVRMKPYKQVDGKLLLDVQQIIPLPEAVEYTVGIKKKEQAEQGALKERHQLRYQFWAELLAYAKTKTPIHAKCGPGVYNWIGGGIGRTGFGLVYSVREMDSQGALYIDLGPGCDTKNEQAFAALKTQQQQVESAFGGPLEWQDLPETRACRIRKVVPGGWRSAHDTWPTTHAALVDTMIRLDAAFRPLVQKLQL